MKKKIILTLAILVLVFGAATCLKTQAGTGENGAGWLWGGTDNGAGNNTGVGWVSMNSLNCDTNDDGTIDNAACISAGASGGIANYGLNIPTGDGNFSGPGYYAWSPNIGWISFNGANLLGCPGAIQAQRSVNSIQGWARIVGIQTENTLGNSGGWLGCIKLNGTAQDGSPYGVQINTGVNPNTLSGYAWSDELGWIDFSRASIQACVASSVYTYSCFDGATCGDCGATETTNYWICSKTDSCGNVTTVPQADCISNGINTCSNTTCPACPATSNANWKEVAP